VVLCRRPDADTAKVSHAGERRIRYEPGLDGLRAVAIIAVLGVHFDAPDVPGGFLGVDLFFVLSGFLITTLLLQESSRGRIAIGQFYLRRVARLAPGLLALLFAVLILDLAIPFPLGAATARGSLLPVLTYSANWFTTADTLPLGYLSHTWSLAIEEQFYLLWPPILMLAIRRNVPMSRLLLGVGLTILGVVVLRIALFDAYGFSRIYTNTFARADAPLMGTALAIGIRMPSLRARLARVTGAPVTALAGLALLAASLLASTPDSWLYLGGFTVIAACAAVLVAHVHLHASTPAGRLLASRPLASIGAISYGIYLFHFPISVALRQAGLTHTQFVVIGVGMSVALAAVSHRFLERPAQSRILFGSTSPQRSLRTAGLRTATRENDRPAIAGAEAP
jgi:peptidoglycan/LPS O-acetylase OafA/YrhL